MTSLHLVDPELVPGIDPTGGPPLSDEILPEIRAFFDQLAEQIRQDTPVYPGIAVSEHFVPGSKDSPDVRVLFYHPIENRQPLPAVLRIHGGGFVFGSPEIDDKDAKWMVDQVGCCVVSVDYRLAPETPFPGSIEDCYAALTWLHTNAEALGVDPDRIALYGESAGGGLAAALSLLARDRGVVPLLYQMLIYPMLDDRTCTDPNPHPYSGEFIWNAESNRFAWKSFLNSEPGLAGVSPYAAPARAEKLEGCPATFICVGSLDLFLEEDLAFTRRLSRAGVPTELHVYPGAYHWFPFLVPNAQLTKEFTGQIAHALQRGLKIHGASSH